VELALEAGVQTKTHVLNLACTGWSTNAPQARPKSPRQRAWRLSRSQRRMSSAMTACAAGSRGCAVRHDPASAAIVIMMRSLKVYGMAVVP
jgi:hypothetical protein